MFIDINILFMRTLINYFEEIDPSIADYIRNIIDL